MAENEIGVRTRDGDLPMYDRDAAERHFERTLDLWRRNAGKP